eukprot:14861427-Alexandrium_andersonii.AAC.1
MCCFPIRVAVNTVSTPIAICHPVDAGLAIAVLPWQRLSDKRSLIPQVGLSRSAYGSRPLPGFVLPPFCGPPPHAPIRTDTDTDTHTHRRDVHA